MTSVRDSQQRPTRELPCGRWRWKRENVARRSPRSYSARMHTSVLAKGAMTGERGARDGICRRGTREGATCQGETCHSLSSCHLHKQTYITGRQAASYVFPFMFPHARSHKPVSLVSRAVQSFTVASSTPALTTVLLPAVERATPLSPILPPYLINKSVVRSVFRGIPTKFSNDDGLYATIITSCC